LSGLWHGSVRIEAPKGLQILRSKLTETAKTELVSAAPQFPTWLARLIGKMVHG